MMACNEAEGKINLCIKIIHPQQPHCGGKVPRCPWRRQQTTQTPAIWTSRWSLKRDVWSTTLQRCQLSLPVRADLLRLTTPLQHAPGGLFKRSSSYSPGENAGNKEQQNARKPALGHCCARHSSGSGLLCTWHSSGQPKSYTLCNDILAPEVFGSEKNCGLTGPCTITG